MDGIDGLMADKNTRVQVIATNASRPYMSDLRVPQTPSLPGIEGSDEFLATIQELTNMVDEQEVRDTYTYLFNYDVGNVLDIPLTYQKDMIVYNTDKIAGYTFTGTPYFFDILSLEPAE